MNDLLIQHSNWLNTHLAMVYCAIAGALVRFLLVRNENLLTRTENGLAGIILALVLAEPTANYLNQSSYAEGYAVFYGLVARELVVSFIDTINDKAIPMYQQIIDNLPFVKHTKNYKPKEHQHDYDDSNHPD